jgi:DNA polymerase III epsilon subunit-like protein
MSGESGEYTEKRFGVRASLCSVSAVGHTWIEQPIYFVDFEGSRASGILEFGVVQVHGGRIVSSRTRLCHATGPIREEDAAVHGLREEILEASRPFADEWDYFSGLREAGPLAAHYAGVENGLLKSVWPYPHSVPDFARPGTRAVEWGPWVDTARLYSQFYPQFSSGRLEALVGVCGLQATLDELAAEHCPAPRRRYHAALYDALAGALLLASLARDPQLAGLTTMQLLALSTLDGEKRDALQQRELF